MSKKFKHLNLSPHWQQYFSKYPQGYTIIENLIDWVSQVDDMVDNQNELNDTIKTFGDRLDEFIGQYDTHLQEIVEQTLSDWQDSGFLDVVINEALDTKYHQMDERLTSQLQQSLSRNRNSNVFANKPATKASIMFIDDDVRREAYDIVFNQVVKEKNIPYAFAVNPGFVDVRPTVVTKQELTEMRDHPLVTLMNHTMSHPALATVSEQTMTDEIGQAEKWLQDFGVYTRSLVPPFGSSNYIVENVATKFVDSLFISVAPDGVNSLNGVGDTRFTTKAIKRLDLSLPITELKNQVDLTIENNALMVVSTHAWYGPESENQNQNFELSKLLELISYVEAQPSAIDIVSYDEAMARFSNPIDIEINNQSRIVLTQNGGRFGMDLPVGNKGLTTQAPHADEPPLPTLFIDNGVTRHAVSASQATSLGYPSGGTLITHRYGSGQISVFTHQYFLPIRSSKMMYRSYDDTLSAWTEFSTIPPIKRYNISIGDGYNDITSGSSRIMPISVADVVLGDTLTIAPLPTSDVNLPAGVIYQVEVTATGKTHLRLTNLSDSNFNPSNSRWLVTKTETRN